MTIKPDSWIIEQCQNNAMINPYESNQVTSDSEGNPVISYGVSSYGYDVTCAPEFKIFTNLNSTVIDPKNFNTDNFVTFKGNECIIPPNSFILTRTREYFKIPRDVIAVCYGKSTYARTGVSIECTVMEPGFEGHIVLEFANTTPLPAKIYANEGVAQLVFYQSDTPCDVSYSDRKGKYMGQTGVTLPRLKK